MQKSLVLKPLSLFLKHSLKKKKIPLRELGAELIEVPAVPYENPNNYVKYAKKVADDIGGYWGNQFDNTINQQAHIETTAEEIWTQTNGEVDGFICASGTGGTISGVSIGLKKHNKNIKIAVADPHGSALYSHFNTGNLIMSGTSVTEGIGTSRITKEL